MTSVCVLTQDLLLVLSASFVDDSGRENLSTGVGSSSGVVPRQSISRKLVGKSYVSIMPGPRGMNDGEAQPPHFVVGALGSRLRDGSDVSKMLEWSSACLGRAGASRASSRERKISGEACIACRKIGAGRE